MSIGLDVVGVDRFRALLQRAPAFPERFFTPGEVAFARRAPNPAQRLAGTFAAKEAVMKALGLTPAPAWSRRIEIARDPNGCPYAVVGERRVALSISHDAGVAIAVATGDGP